MMFGLDNFFFQGSLSICLFSFLFSFLPFERILNQFCMLVSSNSLFKTQTNSNIFYSVFHWMDKEKMWMKFLFFVTCPSLLLFSDVSLQIGGISLFIVDMFLSIYVCKFIVRRKWKLFYKDNRQKYMIYK